MGTVCQFNRGANVTASDISASAAETDASYACGISEMTSRLENNDGSLTLAGSAAIGDLSSGIEVSRSSRDVRQSCNLRAHSAATPY